MDAFFYKQESGMFVSFHSFSVCLPLQTIISKVNLVQRFSVVLKITLIYHYVTALITLLELRPRGLSPQYITMQMTRVEACIKTKYDSLRKFRVFEISPSITLLQGLTKHQNRLRRYDPIFFFCYLFLYIRVTVSSSK